MTGAKSSSRDRARMAGRHFSNVPIDGEAGGITSDLEIWEWRKMVEDETKSDEAIFAGEITYIEPNHDGTAADQQHDYVFQNNQTDMEF